MVIKCKICGGDITLSEDKTFGSCEYCGSTTTLPKIDSEQRAAAFNRGNHFRRIGEFDKALASYERIVQENPADAEAHWCCVLCRFGIEYVEDPATYEWLPTCHRASFDSILEDVDYLAALEYSDGITKRQYQKDAAKIAEVQKGILAASQNTDPYDVFICYKETDENGQRTRDSMLAQDIYYQLTEQGHRVFFSRITLEDVAGTQYEPYIFAALNSAKVMVVVGTSEKNLNAVWVKNEWSRFLAMMRHDRHKLLLPCYRDMDPYDMPEQLGVLQSYDMSKIGFIQDLTRGIAKVLQQDKPAERVKETVVMQQQTSGNTAPLLKRAFMFLEDGEWSAAEEYCEKVLDMDPECAEAYLGKLMAELQVKKQEYLKNEAEPFDGSNHFKKAVRFADEKLKAELTDNIKHINTRNKNAHLRDVYDRAKSAMSAANTENAYLEAAQLFDTISEYLYAAGYAQECREKADDARKDAILAAAKAKMSGYAIDYYTSAMEMLESISGWKDADACIEVCKNQIAEISAEQEAARIEAERIAKKDKRTTIIASAAVCIIIAVALLLYNVIIPAVKYRSAVKLMEDGSYTEAVATFETLDGYKDSAEQATECKYLDAIALMDAGSYAEAVTIFEALDGYKDSAEQIPECKYLDAVVLMDAGETARAAIAFGALGDYKDARSHSIALWDSVAVREVIGVGGYHVMFLSADDTMMAVGNNEYGQCNVSGWRNIIAVSAGQAHSVGLKGGCIVVAVGNNDYDQCDVSRWRDIIAISAGDVHTVGLKLDGTVVAVGWNWHGQCNVSGWTDIVAVNAGDNHTVGLKSDGTVVAVGMNNEGQCDVSGWTDIVAVSAGDEHTVGLKSDGTVVTVGDNTYGQCNVSGWTDIVAVSAGEFHTVGLKADGTVVAVGKNEDGQCDISEWTDIAVISAGRSYTMGAKVDGTVVIVGP